MTDLLFNSNYNYQKIDLQGSTPVANSGVDQHVVLTTGITGSPDFRVFSEISNVRRLWGTKQFELVYVDSGSLMAYVPAGSGAGTFYWRTYVS